MNEEIAQQLTNGLVRLSAAAEALEGALVKLQAQQDRIAEEVGRIVAAIDERLPQSQAQQDDGNLKERIAQLEESNSDLKAQATRFARKTLSPLTSAVLAKSGAEESGAQSSAALDKALAPLTPDQRIAVKAEMARAGLLA